MERNQIFINDEPRSLDVDSTLHLLLCEIGLAGKAGIAIAVNDRIAPRSTWPEHMLQAGDRVVILEATQGG
jgi:sulfur carrier protein